MNAAEIYELVKDWRPGEAWPEGLRWAPHKPGQPERLDKWCLPNGRIDPAHADLMLEAAGARWLDDNLPSAWSRTWRRVSIDAPPTYEVWHADTLLGEGPTRLSAISAAIRAVNSERNRSE